MHYPATYEVHWARANKADQVAALRSGAASHVARQSAEAEARTLRPPRPDLVTIVCECRRERRSDKEGVI